MSNNAGHPSSDAGYSNLEFDLDDLNDIDLIANGTRLATNTPNLTRGRMANGSSAHRNGNVSSSTINGSSRAGGSRSAANLLSRGGLFNSDTEDDNPDPLRLSEPNQPSGSRATSSRTATEPPLDWRTAVLPSMPPSPPGTSNVQRRNRLPSSTTGANSRRRAVGLPELTPDATEEDRDRFVYRRNPRLQEMADRGAAARARRREAMEEAIEIAPPPMPVRMSRPTMSAARERAQEAAAARRAALVEAGPTLDDLERPLLRGAHYDPPRVNNFTTQEEHRDALEAVRISRELDRQEVADLRAGLVADNARLRAEAPRNGIGAGGAGAWGMNQGAEEAAVNDGGWGGGLQGLGRLGGRLAHYLPGPFGFEPFAAGALGERGPNHWMHGIADRNRRFYLGPAHAPDPGGYIPHLPPSIEDAWKGCNYVGHRDLPRSGYTFDFDRENNEAGAEPTDIIRLDTDEDAPWTQELSRRHTEKQHHKPHLVCARCQVPLRVSEGMRYEDDRVYALRCGHVVDAKCLAEMSKPKELVIQPDEVLGADDDAIASGKGKTEDVGDAGTGMPEEDEGIDKLATRSKTRSSKRSIESKDEYDGTDEMASSTTTNHKRKRGRPPTTQTNGTEPSASTSTAAPNTIPVRSKPPRKPVRGRWNNKGSTLPPEEFNWDCPVGGKCGRKYKSLKRGGVWMADPSAAVQLFV